MQSLFSSLFESAAKDRKGGPKINAKLVVNAQLSPYVSKVLKGDENSCSVPLSKNDFKQMEYDQYLVQSFLELYKLSNTEDMEISGSNLYMSILLQKIRAPIEAIAESSDSAADVNFFQGLSQSDMLVANFMSSVDSIKNLNLMLAAHQSLELPEYSIDGYIKAALDEYKECFESDSNCKNEDQLWNKWFKTSGFGLTSPLSTANMKSSGNKTVKERFDISLPIGANTSKELVKNLFEAINIYGGESFDYFSYLKGEKLKAEQGFKKGKINAPGKLVAGLLLKLANQRLVASYKYQKCRLLKQNSENIGMLEKTYNSESNKKRSSGKPAVTKNIANCPSGVCETGSVKVSSGSNAIGVITNSTEVTPSSELANFMSICGNGSSKNRTNITRSDAEAVCNLCDTTVREKFGICKWGNEIIRKVGNVPQGYLDRINAANTTNTPVPVSNPVISAPAPAPAGAVANFMSICGNGSSKNRTNITRSDAEAVCNLCDTTVREKFGICKWGDEIIRKVGNVPQGYLDRINAANTTNAPAPVSTPVISAPAPAGAVANFMSICGNGSSKNRTNITRSDAETVCNLCDTTVREKFGICKWGNEIIKKVGNVPQGYIDRINAANTINAPAPVSTPVISAPAPAGAVANFMSICGNGSSKNRTNITRSDAEAVCNLCDTTVREKFGICKWGNEIIKKVGNVPQGYIDRINVALP